MREDKDPLGIRTNPPAEPAQSIRWRDIGNAIWLLWWLRCTGVPEDWNGKEMAYVLDGTSIPDAQLAARLDVSVRTLAAWRRLLKKLRILFSVPGPGKLTGIKLAQHCRY